MPKCGPLPGNFGTIFAESGSRATNQGRFRPPLPEFVRWVLSRAGQSVPEPGRRWQLRLHVPQIREIAAECLSFGRLRRKLSGFSLHMLHTGMSPSRLVLSRDGPRCGRNGLNQPHIGWSVPGFASNASTFGAILLRSRPTPPEIRSHQLGFPPNPPRIRSNHPHVGASWGRLRPQIGRASSDFSLDSP